MTQLLSYLLISWMNLLRLTCRIRPINDPRERLRREGKTYLFAGLHAHQLSIIIRAEPGTGAMVSRSKDGELIVRVLHSRGVTPIRGSSGGRRKGGATALRALVNHVEQGNPAFLAVDGPKGPRGTVHAGVALLAQKTGAPVLPLSLVPSKRIIVSQVWDRVQIALPFCRIDAHFGEPIEPRGGESLAEFTQRVQDALDALEMATDPSEAARCRRRREERETAAARRAA